MQTLIWVGSAKKELLALPRSVIQQFGYALAIAQEGKKHEHAKPLKGFGGSGVLEITENTEGDTYRSVYTVKFHNYVFVLHCFQKKSKHGISTPKEHVEIIQSRLQAAQKIFKELENEKNKC